MQGFNMGRYYPPSDDPPTFNKNSHPLGHRARKINQGVLTVRFEMPFHIWCQNCPQPTIIAQGVRFNAEKKRVGNYFTTPIWSFRIKHGACGGTIEIRTDPKNTEYVVMEGGKRRDYGDDKESTTGEPEILTAEEKERRRKDAFAALEGKVVDQEQAKIHKDRVDELKEWKDKSWEDPYAASQKLRRTFRQERKALVRKEREREGIANKYSLDIDIKDEEVGDSIAAASVEFGGQDSNDSKVQKAASTGLFQPVESNSLVTKGHTGTTKAERETARRRHILQQEIRGNTRAIVDPFLTRTSHSSFQPISGLRKKQSTESNISTSMSSVSKSALGHSTKDTVASKATSALVNYDSD